LVGAFSFEPSERRGSRGGAVSAEGTLL